MIASLGTVRLSAGIAERGEDASERRFFPQGKSCFPLFADRHEAGRHAVVDAEQGAAQAGRRRFLTFLFTGVGEKRVVRFGSVHEGEFL